MVGDILFAQICLQPPDVNIDTIALVSNIEKVNGIVLNKSENFFWHLNKKGKISEDGNWKKITLLVIVIDNFPPLEQGGHNFGGYRRFITAPFK